MHTQVSAGRKSLRCRADAAFIGSTTNIVSSGCLVNPQLFPQRRTASAIESASDADVDDSLMDLDNFVILDVLLMIQSSFLESQIKNQTQTTTSCKVAGVLVPCIGNPVQG